MTEKTNPRTAILVAVIGLVGVLTSALIANWDKIFTRIPSNVPSSNSTPNLGSATQPSSTPSVANNSPVILNGIRFFEGGANNVPPPDKRVYRNTFSAANTKYVYYELSVTSSEPAKRIDLTINKAYFNPSGVMYCQNSFSTDIGPNKATDSYYGGCSSPKGVWESGTYKVVISVNGKEIAGSFVIQ